MGPTCRTSPAGLRFAKSPWIWPLRWVSLENDDRDKQDGLSALQQGSEALTMVPVRQNSPNLQPFGTEVGCT
jgi:hypothetical protein